MKQEIDGGNIVFGEDETTIPSVRRNLFDKSDQVMRSVTFSYAQKATQEFATLFDGKKVFDNPKSFHDIQRLVEYLTDKDDIVVDFFAGSCTTAHSVLLANNADAGRRRFICVQLPEPLDPEKKEQKVGHDFCVANGLTPTIAEIGKERIRRVFQELESLQQEESREAARKLPGTSEETVELDLGFKVFKLNSSNIHPWDADFDNLEETLFNSVENIKPDRSEADLLYEFIIKQGLDLTLPVEERDICGKTVCIVGLGAMIVCLADDISLDVVEGIAALNEELKPEMKMKVVFKDSGFKDDVVKTNTVQILRQAGIGDVKSL